MAHLMAMVKTCENAMFGSHVFSVHCSNVGTAIINHPHNHHFYGWYTPSKIRVVYDCYIHIMIFVWPRNMHYEFNIRHMSGVFAGLLKAKPTEFTDAEKLVLLWIHESERGLASKDLNKGISKAYQSLQHKPHNVHTYELYKYTNIYMHFTHIYIHTYIYLYIYIHTRVTHTHIYIYIFCNDD